MDSETSAPMEVIFRRRPLHRNFLLVAKTRVEGAWKCYGVPVPGWNHDEEMSLWRTFGDPVPEDIARAAFPEFDEIPYAK